MNKSAFSCESPSVIYFISWSYQCNVLSSTQEEEDIQLQDTIKVENRTVLSHFCMFFIDTLKISLVDAHQLHHFVIF